MDDDLPKYDDVEMLETLTNFVNESKCLLEHMYIIRIPEITDIDNVYSDDHIVLWLADNTSGIWTSYMMGEYYFEDEQDAVACKLRWI